MNGFSNDDEDLGLDDYDLTPVLNFKALLHEMNIKLDEDNWFMYGDKKISIEFDLNANSSLQISNKKSEELKPTDNNKLIIGDKSNLDVNYNLDERRQTYEFKRTTNGSDRNRENSLQLPEADKGKFSYQDWFNRTTQF